MSPDEKQIVISVMAEVLETMAFMFADPCESEEMPEEIPDAIKASMEFCGEEGFGAISLTVPALMCMELASNILGMEQDDPNSQSKAEDALKELLNVVTGRLATGVFGTKPVFTLSVPEVVIMDRDSWITFYKDPNTIKFSADSRLILLTAEFRR